MLRILSSFAVCSALLIAQDTPVEPPAEPQAPALPQANSAEARQMVDQAIAKMIAYGKGTFSTSESQDAAMMRNAGLPFGANDTEVDGGWHRNMVWGDWDGREYVTANGRMLAKLEDGWRLRKGKVSGGKDAPFTLDPSYLMTVLKMMPKDAGNVVHVEAGKLRGKAMVILTTKLDADNALEFSDAGAVPGVGGGFGGVMMFGGLGRGEPERPEVETYLAFYVDAESGDLARFAAKSYETNSMMGNIQIAVGGGGAVEEDEEEEEEVDENAPVKWKRGFPRIKPAKDQSVMTFRADFKKLGLAEPPELGDKQKALLRVR